MQMGVLEDLVQKLGEWSPIPVTYAGGVRTVEDLEMVKKVGNGKVNITVGSALDIFGGKLSYEHVVQWHYAQMKASDDTLSQELGNAAATALATVSDPNSEIMKNFDSLKQAYIKAEEIS
mmetsp:Transcript_6753/g.7760  ORF Transcript_6753/g.7760 Transcript_6753/m.7760 type:complete len:120 (-) Transcript_6753:398-757(-)